MSASLIPTDAKIRRMVEADDIVERIIADLRERNVEPTRLQVIAVATDIGHDSTMVDLIANAAAIQLGELEQ